MSCIPEFDFDNWKTLAEQDPAAFEDRRQKVLRQIIDEGCNPPQLEQLQESIDEFRYHAASPLAACEALSALMWSTYFSQYSHLSQLLRSHQR